MSYCSGSMAATPNAVIRDPSRRCRFMGRRPAAQSSRDPERPGAGRLFSGCTDVVGAGDTPTPIAASAAAASAFLLSAQAGQQRECSHAWPVLAKPNGRRGS